MASWMLQLFKDNPGRSALYFWYVLGPPTICMQFCLFKIVIATLTKAPQRGGQPVLSSELRAVFSFRFLPLHVLFDVGGLAVFFFIFGNYLFYYHPGMK